MAVRFLLMLSVTGLALGQRPFFAGNKPIGYPAVTTTLKDGLGNRFAETDESASTPRLPVEALGDVDLVDRLAKLPKDKQPFWLLNWQALEEQRKNPMTYPQRQSHFAQPLNTNINFSNNDRQKTNFEDPQFKPEPFTNLYERSQDTGLFANTPEFNFSGTLVNENRAKIMFDPDLLDFQTDIRDLTVGSNNSKAPKRNGVNLVMSKKPNVNKLSNRFGDVKSNHGQSSRKNPQNGAHVDTVLSNDYGRSKNVEKAVDSEFLNSDSHLGYTVFGSVPEVPTKAPGVPPPGFYLDSFKGKEENDSDSFENDDAANSPPYYYRSMDDA